MKEKVNAELIKSSLNNVDVYAYKKTASTNADAVASVRNDATLPALFVADVQTDGRGTRGRSFYSAKGGLYMSLAVKVPDEALDTLTPLAAAATHKVLEEMTGKTLGIKWVNDIYLDGKKVCGILCERVADAESGESLAAVIGIGINLDTKRFPKELRDIAADLGAKELSKNLLAAKLTNSILGLLSGDGDFMNYYKEHSIMIGRELSFAQNEESFTAVAVDIDEKGRLVVKTADGKIRTLCSGDVVLKKPM